MANKKISCYFHESSHFDRPHGYTFTLKSFLLEYLNFYSQIEIIRTTLFFGLHYQIYQIISIPNKITGCISNAYLPRQIYQKRKKMMSRKICHVSYCYNKQQVRQGCNM